MARRRTIHAGDHVQMANGLPELELLVSFCCLFCSPYLFLSPILFIIYIFAIVYPFFISTCIFFSCLKCSRAFAFCCLVVDVVFLSFILSYTRYVS
jgi:hypothetical protein